ncbi:PH domain-containing protein [Lentzea indica]|uniref:PH domain-containing protein n=1 Tax=Lentzea indica TaxID=2604800 RepID=UPI00143BDE4F|nr:PH domain-containing protein [Lentzea indica]
MTLTDDELIIRNTFRTHRIKWQDVKEIDRDQMLNRERVIVRTKDGRTVPCDSFSGLNLSNERVGVKLIKAVNRRLVDR